jgi:hypothetical protein
MIDNNKILQYKSVMLLNSQGGAKLLGVWFSDILNLPSVISENEFKGALEYCKAKRKLELEKNSALLSDNEKQRMELKIDQEVESLGSIIKDILRARGILLS